MFVFPWYLIRPLHAWLSMLLYCIQISAQWTSFSNSASAIGSSACMASGEYVQDSLILLGIPNRVKFWDCPGNLYP